MSSAWPLGALELKVLDLERQAGFYEWFGLTKLAGDEGSATFGAGGKPVLRLTATPGLRRRPRRSAGLYHFAILLPNEEELGGFLRRSLEEKLPLTGTSDHFVSQALYYDDPEGNGIEVYADRPRSEWTYPGGQLNIGIEHLDFERLLRIADKPQPKFSDPTLLGHMHLNVGDLDRPPFEDLYRDYLGRIYAYVRAQVPTAADAEDITAQVFMNAYQAYGRFEARNTSPV